MKKALKRKTSSLNPTKTMAVVVASIVTGTFALLFMINAQAAPPPAATGNTSQATSTASQTNFANLIQDVTKAPVYTYGTKDNKGVSMDTAKVIENPAGGYLAVYYNSSPKPSEQVVKLASSTDLKTWNYKTTLSKRGGKPTIAKIGGKGFVLAYEAATKRVNSGNFESNLRFVHYPSLETLYANKPDKTYTAPRKLSKCNEGSPNFTSINMGSNPSKSAIRLYFHYASDCKKGAGRIGSAILSDFKNWNPTKMKSIDSAAAAASRAAGQGSLFHVGDNDSVNYESTKFTIIEGQSKYNSPTSWQPYLYNNTTKNAQLLTIKTHGGSKSFSKPSITSVVKGPDGSKGYIIGLFVYSESAGPGEAGELIYYIPVSKAVAAPKPVPTTQPATQAVPVQ